MKFVCYVLSGELDGDVYGEGHGCRLDVIAFDKAWRIIQSCFFGNKLLLNVHLLISKSSIFFIFIASIFTYLEMRPTR